MDREIDVLSYIPDFLQDFREFRELADSENPEILALWGAMEDVLKDQFVNDATENGVKRWESILKITPKGTDSLEVRKFRILTRLNEKLPYTYRLLELQLSTLCGKSGYFLELRNNEYKLKVRVALTAKGMLAEVENLLKRIVPANMEIDLSLLYNQNLALNGLTHAKLSKFTHEQLRSEVF
ncbi:MAG TPA: putative phage tail protein [Ruminiclostridium sp.]|nr:putative phage tail protein [Ruminiclostridium sp.]